MLHEDTNGVSEAPYLGSAADMAVSWASSLDALSLFLQSFASLFRNALQLSSHVT